MNKILCAITAALLILTASCKKDEPQPDDYILGTWYGLVDEYSGHYDSYRSMTFKKDGTGTMTMYLYTYGDGVYMEYWTSEITYSSEYPLVHYYLPSDTFAHTLRFRDKNTLIWYNSEGATDYTLTRQPK